MIFRDRSEAGKTLAHHLSAFADRDPVILGLPRGGVPVAYEVAQALRAPLDILVVRKLGAPQQPEFGFGAVSADTVVLDHATVRMLGLSRDEIDRAVSREMDEVVRRERVYRGSRAQIPVRNRVVIVVDDGLATGVTARAAVAALRKQAPAEIVFAAPVCAPDSAERLATTADQVICVSKPEYFAAVGQWYENFEQTEDEEVIQLLRQSSLGTQPRTVVKQRVKIQADGKLLEGDLVVPENAQGIVLFAHGSGSSRRSSRNIYVAEELQRAGVGTLLFDLLTEKEAALDEYTGELRFDIPLLARRLDAAAAWLQEQPGMEFVPLGYFGASTGGAAALVAAASRPRRVRAVVSRGGRPDLAGDALEQVDVPVLLIVGSEDNTVLELNRQAYAQLRHGIAELSLVPGATHLFEEPGTLEQVAKLAATWFQTYLRPPPIGEATHEEQPRPEM